jgi:hypothetical protein
MRVGFGWSVVVVVALASCGSGTNLGGDGGGAGTGGGGAGGQAAVTRDPQCPASAPAMGAACNVAVTCDYGADARHACVTSASCNGGQWYVSAPDARCGLHLAPCPDTFASIVAGAACPAAGISGACDYDEGRCQCLPCFTGGQMTGSTWACRAWNGGTPECPAPAPLAGTSCAMENQFCYYSGFCGVGVGANYKCTGGYWRTEPSAAGSCVQRQCAAATQ